MIEKLLGQIDFSIDDRRLVSKLERLFIASAKYGDDVIPAMKQIVGRDHYIAATVFLRLAGKIPDSVYNALRSVVDNFDLSAIKEQSHFLAALVLKNDEAVRCFLSRLKKRLDRYIQRLADSDNAQEHVAYLINQSLIAGIRNIGVFSSIARHFRITDKTYAEMCRDTIDDILSRSPYLMTKLLRSITTIFEELPLSSYCSHDIYSFHEMMLGWPNIHAMILFRKLLSKTELPNDEQLRLLKGFVPEDPGDDLRSAACYLYFAYSVILDPQMSADEMRSFTLPPLTLDLENRTEIVQEAFIKPFIRLMETGSSNLRLFIELTSSVNPYRMNSGYRHIRMYHIVLVSRYDADYYTRLFLYMYKKIIKDDSGALTYIYLNSPLRCWMNLGTFMEILYIKWSRIINSPDLFDHVFTAKVKIIQLEKGNVRRVLVRSTDSDQPDRPYLIMVPDTAGQVSTGDVISFRVSSYDGKRRAVIADDMDISADSVLSAEEAEKETRRLCELSNQTIFGLAISEKLQTILITLHDMPEANQLRILLDRIEYMTGYEVRDMSELRANTFSPGNASRIISSKYVDPVIESCYRRRNIKNTPQTYDVLGNIIILRYKNYYFANKALVSHSCIFREIADITGRTVVVLPAEHAFA